MTTSIPPDAGKEAECVAALPRLPRDAGGPVFAEPWQAQVFALAVKLSEEGHFTWNEWAAALGDELRAASDRGEPDNGSHYYHHWLAALERLVTAKACSIVMRYKRGRKRGPKLTGTRPMVSRSNSPPEIHNGA